MATWLRFGDPLGMVGVSKDLGKGANGVLTRLTRVIDVIGCFDNDDDDKGEENEAEGRGDGTRKLPAPLPDSPGKCMTVEGVSEDEGIIKGEFAAADDNPDDGTFEGVKDEEDIDEEDDGEA